MKLRKPYIEMTMKEKYDFYKIKKTGFLDIEANGLKGNFAFMLSWVLVIMDMQTGKWIIKYDVINRKDIDRARKARTTTKDKRILESLLKEISKLDLLVAHYGIGWNKMDMPFIRTRTAYNFKSLDLLPSHKKLRFCDTWSIAHKLLSLHSYRLDVVGEALGIKTKKTPVTGLEWQLAQDGDSKSLKYVLNHNIKDAIILAKVYKKLEHLVNIPATYI